MTNNKEANLACVHTPGAHSPKGDQRCYKCKHGPWQIARQTWREFCENRASWAALRRESVAVGIALNPKPRWRRAGL